MATSKVGSRVVTWGLVLQLAGIGLADAAGVGVYPLAYGAFQVLFPAVSRK